MDGGVISSLSLGWTFWTQEPGSGFCDHISWSLETTSSQHFAHCNNEFSMLQTSHTRPRVVSRWPESQHRLHYSAMVPIVSHGDSSGSGALSVMVTVLSISFPLTS